MTPEEQAVIEAAEALVDYLRMPVEESALYRAVQALRKSREPRPRFVEGELGIFDRLTSKTYGMIEVQDRYHLTNLLNDLDGVHDQR